jgi:tetratricopeptide (TPR) repeat protein
MAGVHEERVLAGLVAACRADLLEEVDETDYQFVHDVVREVIEADLGAALRSSLHGQIGLALERSGAPYETLAYHFARSLDDEKAIFHLARAGDLAEAQHANATAEGYFRELADRLEGVGRLGEAAHAREKLGRVLTTEGRYPDALMVFEQSVRGHRENGDGDAEARAAAQIGRVHYLKGTPGIGSVALEGLRLRLEARPSSRGTAALNNALAPLHMAQGEYDDQLRRAEQAADIARKLGDQPTLAEAEVWRGCALNQLGEVEEGRQVLEGAVSLAEAANDLTSAVHATNDLGFLCEIGGQFEQSRLYRDRALEIAIQVGDQAAIANMGCRRGQIDYLMGEWASARELFNQSLSVARRVEAASVVGYPLFGLGLLALAVGDGDTVKRNAGECLVFAERTSDRQILQAGNTLLAEHELQEDRPEDAYARLSTLQPDAHGLELYSLLPVLAEACVATGHMNEAQGYIEIGMQRAEASNNRVARIELLRVRALSLIAGGSPNDARAVLEQALEMARAMSYPYAVARLLTAAAMSQAVTRSSQSPSIDISEARSIFRRLGATWYLRA